MTECFPLSSTDPNPYVFEGDGAYLLTDRMSVLDARQRIQALLAQWLRMENITVLLGAGASKPRGGPLISELESFTLAAAEDFCTDTAFSDFLPLVTARQKAISSKQTTIHFEKWLSYLTTAKSVISATDTPISNLGLTGMSSVSAGALTDFITLLSQIIFVRCSLALPELEVEATGHHAFLAKLAARDPTLGRPAVFTTNYDTLIEQALDDLGIRYADGFSGTVRRRFDTSDYGLDIYYPGNVSEGRVRRYDKYLQLYHLHGAVHWRRFGQRIIQVDDPQLGQWEQWQKQNLVGKAEALAKWMPDDESAIGIIPTECKFVETLGMPYAHLFRALHEQLQQPQTFLLVLGYSFGDDHINAVIDDAMTNPSVVMLAVDPFPTSATVDRIERYRESGERAFLLTSQTRRNPPIFATFDDFAQNLMPNVQWLNDFLQLRRTEQSISRTDALPGNGDGDHA